LPDEVTVLIQTNGVVLQWPAPSRAQTTFLGAAEAVRWVGLDSAAVVPSVHVTGVYQAYRDRRIQVDVLSIDSLGTAIGQGIVARDHIRLAWASSFPEVNASGNVVAGSLDLPVGYAGQGMQFLVPKSNPALPPDSTTVGGIRIAFTPGAAIRSGDAVLFDMEDFEGWHVWRWSADPTSPEYIAAGEGSKLAMTGSPLGTWGASEDGMSISFIDHNVFNGFLYYYAITAYDQGFHRKKGTDLAVKFDSPLHLATRNADGSVTLGSTQIRVPYNQVPPATFMPITASPNPFRESDIRPNDLETTKVTFFNAPLQGTLYVWTVAGDLVMQRDQPLNADGVMQWDTRNQSGEKVASGVYIYKIVDASSGQQSYGRLAIIR
jgi:hypothetical protein